MAHRAMISLSSSPCCIWFLTAVALHVSCLFEIEKHFKHALWSWPGNTAQAELTAWAVRNFCKWNSTIKTRNKKCLKGIFLWNSGFSDALQRALLCVGSCLWTADVWLLWLAEQLQSRRVVQKLLSCPAAMQGSSPPSPAAAAALQPMARQAAGSVFGHQRWPSRPPRTGPEHVVVPFLAVHHAAGPSQSLLTSQGQSCMWVGELENAPKMDCVFKECACVCKIFSNVVSLLVFW